MVNSPQTIIKNKINPCRYRPYLYLMATAILLSGKLGKKKKKKGKCNHINHKHQQNCIRTNIQQRLD